MTQSRRGLIVVLEGSDQSGKKTQTSLLTNRLKNEGYNAEALSFPDYSTPIGKEIKAFFEGKRTYPLQVRHMLLAANRWEKKDLIEQIVRKGRILVVDRYSESNLAYGVANGLPLKWLLNLEENLPKAELVVVIDISPEVSLRRKKTGRDMHEKDIHLQTRVRETYKSLSEGFGWITVNGEMSINEVHEEIWRHVRRFLAIHVEEEHQT